MFSGIGSPEKALQNLSIDYELVGFSEIDKYAAKSYSAIHGVDESLNLGDITKINEQTLPKDIDLMTYGFPCFTKDTLVLTQDGYKEIKDIQIGDYVLDHTNSYNKVMNIFDQGKKEIWNIKAMSSDNISTTENHRFLVRKRRRVYNNEKGTYDRVFDSPEWKECKNLTKDDYLGISINQNNKLPFYNGVEYPRRNGTQFMNKLNVENKKLWYLCGRYLGDGWIKRRKDRNNHICAVIICCGKHEEGEIEKEIGNTFKYTKVEDTTTFKYIFSNMELALFMSQFGCGAKNKRIPGFAFDLPKEYIKELLRGYWDSDGCAIGSILKATSISRELIYGIGQLIAKAYNRPYSIYFTNRKPKCVIEGRMVNQNDTYTIAFKKENCKQDRAFYENGYLWVPIRKIENTGKFENVYDIEVENAHSFTANGVIAHNCQDISVAGKQAGFKDENGNKTRSGLFFDALRIIKYVQPKVAIAENVKNLTGKKFKNEFEIVLNSLDEAGYNCYWKVLNAKNFGVPQNRERVFIVSIRKDIDNGLFQFPDETQIDLRLKDVLESDVDEKYYLSEKAMSKIKFLDIDYERTDRILVEASLNPEKKVQDRARVLSSQGLCQTICSTDYKDPAKILQVAQIYPNSGNPQAGRIYDVDGISPSIDTCSGGNRMPKVINGDIKPRLIGGIGEQNFGKQYRQGNRIYDSDAIAMALTSSPVGNNGENSYLYKVTSAAMRARNNDVGDYEQVVEISDREISNSITTVQKDSLTCEKHIPLEPNVLSPKRTEYGKSIRKMYESGHIKESRHNMTAMVPRTDGICNTLTTVQKDNYLYEPIFELFFRVRRLTPKECWRLMGFTDEDFEKAKVALNERFFKGKNKSNSQLYKQAGNSIVVQVMESIYKQLQLINKL